MSEATDRRTFLQAGAAASASALALASGLRAQEPEKKPPIPRRTLGKTGVEVTMLEAGAVRGGADRILRLAFAAGIRTFDTAKVYGTEPDFRRWFEAAPDVRKQIFLVTKDGPRQPAQMMGMVDERLKNLGTDYIDLFFIHGLGDDHGADGAVKLLKSPEFRQAADAIRKSGKAKFIGFSTHHRERHRIIEAAAQEGVVDAIMLQYTPWLEKDSPLNKAIDLAHSKGIGLISMKQVAGRFQGNTRDIIAEVQKKAPFLKDKNLTPFQGLLHAIWTDERISAACVSMRNTDQLREDADAARRYEPLKVADIRALRNAAIDHGQTLCADCDGRCSLAAGTKAELGNLTRFLTYHEHLGDRTEARRQYAALADEARDWAGADLEAARAACPNGLDFARLLPEVERHLA
jgi:aryl-alcohol dehydrogenase-like predicted oxidoreductase